MSAEAAQFLLDAFVAAVNVVDTVHVALTLRHQCSQHQRGAGSQVRSNYSAALKWGGSTDDGFAAIDGDIRAHADHFASVHEAILENGFGDDRGSFGLCGQGH